MKSKFRGYKYDSNVGIRLPLTVETESTVVRWYLREHNRARLAMRTQSVE